MLHGSIHPGVTGSELTRLLARLADPAQAAPAAAPAAGAAPLAERLGHWLGWTGAIGLAGALAEPAGTAPPAAQPAQAQAAACQRAGAEAARVQAALARGNAAAPRPDPLSPTDLAPLLRHVLARQQAMHEAVSALRQGLRLQLVAQSPALARLAAIDAALDQALAPQERGLLGLVGLRLQAHGERLRAAAGDAPGAAWHTAWQAEGVALLQAELSHRLLPVQGLLAAWRDACLAPATTPAAATASPRAAAGRSGAGAASTRAPA